MKRWQLLAWLGALAVGCGGPLPDKPSREVPADEALSPGLDPEEAESWRNDVSAQWNTPRPRLGPAYLVKDIFPPSEQDPTGEAEAPGPENLVDVGGTLFFSTTFRTAGEVLLWKSDGTAPGTVPLLRLPTVVRPETSPFLSIAVMKRLAGFFARQVGAGGGERFLFTVDAMQRLEGRGVLLSPGIPRRAPIVRVGQTLSLKWPNGSRVEGTVRGMASFGDTGAAIPRWIGGFRKVGVLVQSAVGLLQVKHYAKQDDIKRLVATDEDELLKYLAQED